MNSLSYVEKKNGYILLKGNAINYESGLKMSSLIEWVSNFISNVFQPLQVFFS